MTAIADALPKPVPTSVGGLEAYRFKDRSLQQALLLKLVKFVNGLSAAQLLLNQGYLLEVGSIQRSLDEIHEDVLFLALPLFGKEKLEAHSKYLDSFWEEEPPFREFSSSQKNRYQFPRRTIRSYLLKNGEDSDVDHRGIAVSAYLSRMYSGYVHAAAPHILDQYDPELQQFRVRGYTSPDYAPRLAGVAQASELT